MQNHHDCIRVARDVLAGFTKVLFKASLVGVFNESAISIQQFGSYASSVCVSFPSLWGLENRCITHSLGGSGQLCVCSSGSHSSGDSRWSPTGAESWLHQGGQGFFRWFKMTTFRCRFTMIESWWSWWMSWLWDLVDLSTNLLLRLLCGERLRLYFKFIDVANFFYYFFKETNLKPSTIAGFRITIADCFAWRGISR